MADDRLSRLERRWGQTQTEEDLQAWENEQLRCGLREREEIALARAARNLRARMDEIATANGLRPLHVHLRQQNPLARRRSGRTTRMLLEACARASLQESVLIAGRDADHGTALLQAGRAWLQAAGFPEGLAHLSVTHRPHLALGRGDQRLMVDHAREDPAFDALLTWWEALDEAGYRRPALRLSRRTRLSRRPRRTQAQSEGRAAEGLEGNRGESPEFH